MRMIHCIDGGQCSCFCTVMLTGNCLLLTPLRLCRPVAAAQPPQHVPGGHGPRN